MRSEAPTWPISGRRETFQVQLVNTQSFPSRRSYGCNVLTAHLQLLTPQLLVTSLLHASGRGMFPGCLKMKPARDAFLPELTPHNKNHALEVLGRRSSLTSSLDYCYCYCHCYCCCSSRRKEVKVSCLHRLAMVCKLWWCRVSIKGMYFDLSVWTAALVQLSPGCRGAFTQAPGPKSRDHNPNGRGGL